MKSPKIFATSLLLFTFFSIELFAQVQAVIITDKASYSYGETMRICRYAYNPTDEVQEVFEEGCCSDQVIVNGKNYHQYYQAPYTSVGECIPNYPGDCHLGYITWPINPGEYAIKGCLDLLLVDQIHCSPGTMNTFEFEVTDPLRIQVVVEYASLSEEYIIPINLILPVELEKWEAELRDTIVSFSWTTLSENDNAYFEIEMSDKGDYQVIGSVNGNGSTIERNSYNFDIPNLESGTYKFRLSQTDFDGTRRELGELEIHIPLDGEYEISTPYPNPSTSAFKLDLKVRSTQYVEIKLYDLFGRTLATLHNSEVRANETIQVSSAGLDLANGSYVYQVRGERFAKDGILTIQK